VTLHGTIHIPEQSVGLVIFSHGSGSSRFSPRNKYVANVLQQNGLATLLFDLLTSREDAIYKTRFDMPLLANRLIDVTKWIKNYKGVNMLPIGYFGASTGAASALKAAAVLKDQIAAVVSRGGRPDLVFKELANVTAATLLIVGESDTEVLELNKKAYQQLRGERSLKIIPNATHLFEEQGKLEEVAQLSARWFVQKLKI